MLGIPLSLLIGNSCRCDSLTRVWGTLGSKLRPYMLQGSLISKPSEIYAYNEYTPEKRARMGRYVTETTLSK